MSRSSLPYLAGIDGMRALAVIAVMVYHANVAWLPGGFIGVEVFFVISGYLITLLLIGEHEQTGRVNLGQFYLRRARRLLPALLLLLSLVTVYAALFKRSELGQMRGDVVAGLTYVTNWYQIWVGQGYTASGSFAPLRHLWSLAVEEQFYLVWPLVMIAMMRVGRGRLPGFSRWLLLAALVVAVAGGLLIHPGREVSPVASPDAYWTVAGQSISKLDALYLSTITRCTGLLIGAALAMLWRPVAVMRSPIRNQRHVVNILAIIGLGALVILSLRLQIVNIGGVDPLLFRGGFLAVDLATVLVMVAATHRRSFVGRLLGIRPLSWIGTRSYGLYLFHWPIFQVIRKASGNPLDGRQFAQAMVLTVFVTELSYRLVEMPIRTRQIALWIDQLRVRVGPIGRRMVGFGTAACVSLVAFAGASIAMADRKESQSASVEESFAAGEDVVTNLATGVDVRAPDTTSAVTTEAATTEPTVTEPTVTEPATTEPAVTDPAVAEPATTEPAVTEPAVTAVEPSTTDVLNRRRPATVPISTSTTTTTMVAAATTTVPTTVATTRPSTTAPAPAPPTRVVAIGDSVMLGAAENLAAAGVVVDADKSRQMIDYLPTVQQLSARRWLGDLVVVHLGTNGPFNEATMSAFFDALAGVPDVIVLTVHADRPWTGRNNERILALPDKYPNVRVIDWDAAVGDCPGNCLYDDGIHLPPDGRRYYAQLIFDQAGID